MNDSLSLSQFGITRPTKIRWMHDASTADVLATIRSRSLKKFLQNMPEVMVAENISVESIVFTTETFIEWLIHYEAFVKAKHYDSIASLKWFQQKPAEHKEVRAFIFRKNEQICGTSVYAVQDEKKVFGVYKTNYDALFTNFKKQNTLGALIDYHFLCELRKQGYQWISMGTMRNAFGVINSVGNLYHKLRMGYLPRVAEKTELLSSVPLNELGEVSFLGLKDGQLSLYVYAANNDYSHPELLHIIDSPVTIQVLPSENHTEK